MSSRKRLRVVGPGGRLVVEGAGREASVQDADDAGNSFIRIREYGLHCCGRSGCAAAAIGLRRTVSGLSRDCKPFGLRREAL
ncbi:MAG: hypothetical protein JWP48_2312 [Actinoallomurus sp.]|jgi:hypothetical protein|nr:hypothetical protein [Actinoallomurus sp.]